MNNNNFDATGRMVERGQAGRAGVVRGHCPHSVVIAMSEVSYS